jgi:hypothetical protein
VEILTRAQAFFAENGRAIDRARIAFHFAGGPRDAVADALAAYQNADGGFGHALEVDIAAPASNPFATELALLICLQAGIPREHPLLQRAAAHLEATQEEDGGWRFAPEVYEHELAPWFQGWEWPNLNPACSLEALLRELGLGSAQLHERVAAMFARMADVRHVATGEFYDVRPYAYYFLPDGEQPQRELYLAGVLWWQIRQHLAGTVADAGHFFDYVRGPETYTGRHLPAAIRDHWLDALVAEQQPDGGWPTPYNPGWRGWVTVQNLLVLRAFGRV